MLKFGNRPTDQEGRVQLVIHERRYGKYPVEVSFIFAYLILWRMRRSSDR